MNWCAFSALGIAKEFHRALRLQGRLALAHQEKAFAWDVVGEDDFVAIKQQMYIGDLAAALLIDAGGAQQMLCVDENFL